MKKLGVVIVIALMVFLVGVAAPPVLSQNGKTRILMAGDDQGEDEDNGSKDVPETSILTLVGLGLTAAWIFKRRQR